MRVIAGDAFEVVDVRRDGNCLFNAFSHGLVGSSTLSWDLREETVRVVSGDWDTFQAYTETGKGEPYSDVDAYSTFRDCFISTRPARRAIIICYCVIYLISCYL